LRYWIVEIFTSIQGEGDVIGRPSNFIRLAGCNLRCVWCDTKYSWTKYDGKEMSIDDILKNINLNIKYTTITGGEPLLQNIEPLAKMLKEYGHFIIVETNGTIKPSEELKKVIDIFSVSPKLSNSGFKINYKFEDDWASYYKFVIDKIEDLLEVKSFIEKHNIDPKKVIVQPNGLSKDYIESLRELADAVMRMNIPFRVLPQLHRIISYR